MEIGFTSLQIFLVRALGRSRDMLRYHKEIKFNNLKSLESDQKWSFIIDIRKCFNLNHNDHDITKNDHDIIKNDHEIVVNDHDIENDHDINENNHKFDLG